jgi:hypothetical protein
MGQIPDTVNKSDISRMTHAPSPYGYKLLFCERCRKETIEAYLSREVNLLAGGNSRTSCQ